MRIIYWALVEMEIQAGPSVHVLEICKNLVKLGCNITAILPKPSGSIRQEFPCKVVYVSFIGFGFWREWFFFKLSAFYLIWQIIKIKPDCIYIRDAATNPLPAIICKAFHVPLISEVNGLHPNELDNTIIHLLHSISLENSSAVIVTSDGLKQKLLNHYNIKNIYVVNNGVDKSLFKPIDKLQARKRLQLEPNKIYVGYIGIFSEKHRVDVLINAFAEALKNFKELSLVLVGTGMYQQECILLTKKLDIEPDVLFRGRVVYEEVPYYINSFDVCVATFSSQKIKIDGATTFKVYEYLACEKAVIANDLPESTTYKLIKDIVKIVPPENPHELANAVIELTDSKEKRELYEKRAKVFIANWNDWNESTKKTLAIIKQVCSG